jgi:adenine-specific DNA-methyltransferase
MNQLLADDRIHFGKDETSSVLFKRYISDVETDPLRGIILEFGGKGVNADTKRLFPEQPDVFPNPKPVPLEQYLLSFVADSEATVLDCFAGSGTTAHAVMRLNKSDDGRRRFILIEEGSDGDEYAATLTAERLRRARATEALPGGFRFMRVGERIDIENWAKLARKQIIETILQTDTSGRDGRIRTVDGAKWVIGQNSRREAICLHHDPEKRTPVSEAILREMYVEAKELGLNKPLRVYAEACEVFGSDSFRFFKLPDEVSNNLVMALRGVT